MKECVRMRERERERERERIQMYTVDVYWRYC